MRPHDFISIFVEPLHELGIDYLVTGSVAAIFYGEPRLTHDIDLVLELKPSHIEPLCERFSLDRYYCPPPEVLELELRRSHRAHFNLIHHTSGLKADCYIFTGDPLHQWAFDNVRTVSLDPGIDVRLAPPEYVIIRKLQYYREGGSEKHLNDIRAMLRLLDDELDREFLERELAQRGLESLLPKQPS